MLKKNLFTILAMVMAMALMVGGCGKDDVGGNPTVESTDMNNTIESEEIIPNTTEAPEIINIDELPLEEREVFEMDGENIFRFSEKSDIIYDVDKTLERFENSPNIVLTSPVGVYNDNGIYLGYTKPNITVFLESVGDEWSTIWTGGCFWVKTEMLKSSMEDDTYLVAALNGEDVSAMVAANTTLEENNSSTENNENNNTKTEENLPSYTVEEMEETIMYVSVEEVNVRKGPGTEYDRAYGALLNDIFIVTGKTSNGWYKVTFYVTLNEGFIKCDYLSVEPTIIEKGEEIPKAPVEESTSKPTESNPPVEQPVATEQPVVTPKPTEAPTPVPTPVPTPDPTPTPAPVKTYTEAEVISIVESTLRGAGLRKPEEDMTAEQLAKYGPTDGMGWAEGSASMTDPQTSANELLSDLQYGGYGLYYLENLGSSNGYVRIRIYYGTP